MSERAFNPYGNRTADGVLITEGLRVMDNNLDVGTVTADDHDGDHGRHEDHWYRIELDHIPGSPDYSGNKAPGVVRSMNGERLSTIFRTYTGKRVTVDERAVELANGGGS